VNNQERIIIPILQAAISTVKSYQKITYEKHTNFISQQNYIGLWKCDCNCGICRWNW